MRLSEAPGDIPNYLKSELSPFEKLLPALIALVAAYLLVR